VTAVHVLAVAMVTVTLGLSALLPMSVAAGVEQLPPASVRHCSD
jgi:hypothetical protein